MPHLRPKEEEEEEEKKKLLWLLSMPSSQLKPYKGGIVCNPLLRALVVTGRGLWLGEGGGEWETFGKGNKVWSLGAARKGLVRKKGKRPLGYLGETGKEIKWTKKSHFSSPVIVVSIPERL